MKIYTSYWAQVRNFPKTLVGLNTTVWPPKWRPLGKDKNGVIVIDCPPLKPGPACEGLCNGKCNPKHPKDCKFLSVYQKQLDAIDFEGFMNSLKKLRDKICADEGYDDVDFALIVFETPQNNCSERLPLWIWLQMNGIDPKEFNKLDI